MLLANNARGVGAGVCMGVYTCKRVCVGGSSIRASFPEEGPVEAKSQPGPEF